MNRDFKGIWIARDVWLSKDLTLQEKVFYVEIDSLDNEEGCWANNQYFADFFDLSTVRVSEVINSLVKKGYVSSDVNQSDGNRRILHALTPDPLKESFKTLLKEPLRPSQRKVCDPLKESFKHSNISNNSLDSVDEPLDGELTVVLDEEYSGFKRRPKKSSFSSSPSVSGSRVAHPIIKTIKSLTRKYPDKILWDGLIAKFGSSFNESKVRECREAWLSRGYNPMALTWLDWYFDGIPGRVVQNLVTPSYTKVNGAPTAREAIEAEQAMLAAERGNGHTV